MFWLAETVSHVVFSADSLVDWKKENWSVWWNDLTHGWVTHLNQRDFGVWVGDSAWKDQRLSLLHVHHIWDLWLHLHKRPLAIWNANAEVRNKHTINADNNLESAASTESLLACYQTLSVVFLVGLSLQFAIFLWQWKALGVARAIVCCSGVIKGTGKKSLNILTKVPQGLLDVSLSCFDSI